MLSTIDINYVKDQAIVTFSIKEDGIFQSNGLVPSYVSLKFNNDEDQIEEFFTDTTISNVYDCEEFSIVYHDKGIEKWKREIKDRKAVMNIIFMNFNLNYMFGCSSKVRIYNDNKLVKEKEKPGISFERNDDMFGPEDIQVISRAYIDKYPGNMFIIIARLMRGKLHSYNLAPSLIEIQVNPNYIDIAELYRGLFRRVSKLRFHSIKEERWYDGEFISEVLIADEIEDQLYDEFEIRNLEIYATQETSMEFIPNGTKLTISDESPKVFIKQLKDGKINYN